MFDLACVRPKPSLQNRAGIHGCIGMWDERSRVTDPQHPHSHRLEICASQREIDRGELRSDSRCSSNKQHFHPGFLFTYTLPRPRVYLVLLLQERTLRRADALLLLPHLGVFSRPFPPPREISVASRPILESSPSRLLCKSQCTCYIAKTQMKIPCPPSLRFQLQTLKKLPNSFDSYTSF